jgi:hypothetical protein
MNDVIIVMICKNESRYLREFIDYHLGIGFDRIVIADNNDIDGERYEDLLKDYIDDFKVQLIDLRGKQGMQKIFYNNLKYWGITYRWAAFIDTDEFITFSETGKKIFGNNIKNFLNSRNYVRAYKLNWRIYGDNGNILYEDKPVTERFPEPLSETVTFHYNFPENYHVKSILRNDVKVNFTDNPHGINELGEYYTPAGNRVGGGPFNESLEYSVLYVRHYYTKSLQEWCENKLGRSYADYLRSDKVDYYPLKDYFIYNEWTEEKQKLLDEHGYEYKR